MLKLPILISNESKFLSLMASEKLRLSPVDGIFSSNLEVMKCITYMDIGFILMQRTQNFPYCSCSDANLIKNSSVKCGIKFVHLIYRDSSWQFATLFPVQRSMYVCVCVCVCCITCDC